MNRFDRVLATAFLSAVTSFANVVAVTAADDPRPPKPAAPDGTSASVAQKPMITQNPNGTFTIQKKRPDESSNESKSTNGLVIPPQVVVPIVPAIEKKL